MSESNMQMVTRHLLIHGKVQGVYFRAAAESEARKSGLRGWVRNRRSGEVEALVSGPEAAVEAFIDWAQQGPPAAHVTRVEISAADAPTTPGFHRYPTE